MNKKNLKIALSSRWAIRHDEALDLASSDFGESYFKDDGQVDHKNHVTKRPDGVAVVHIDGALSYRSDLWSAWLGLDTYNSIENAIDDCVNDPSVLGILFDINSPGGEVSGCADLADKIFSLRDSHALPFGIASRTGGLMCSASYWLGSSAERVFTATNGTIGSIGVLCAYNKTGKNVDVVVSDLSPNKCATPDTDEGLKLVKQELNDLAEVFIDAVARNRATTFENVANNFGQGGVFIGQKAVDAGLVDGVATIDEICEMMVNGKLKQSKTGAEKMTAQTTEPGVVAEQNVATPTAEEIGKNAIAEYKNTIAGVKALFDECGVEQDATAFVDDGKTLADAKEFAFGAMKDRIAKQNDEIVALRDENEKVKAELNARPATDANLTQAQKDAIAKGIQADASAVNGVQGGAQENPTAEQDERKRIDDAFRRGFHK